ncbi:MAG TPA: PepSY-associated TM helix domain-containing protein [Caulobacteraceae bacterium]|jgi:uncharacterized iron-regulated membrane protein|nr:PepSY-associated TM helix domain-containing protein [Caulobacteraceae bacterium]
MKASARGRLRRFWFQLHLWIGIGLALAIIPLCVSGSYLVWRGEIDRALHPARFAISSPQAVLPPSAYLDAAQVRFGDRARVQGLRLPSKPGEPATVTGAMTRPAGESKGGAAGRGPQARPQVLTAWIDPGTARVLDVANVRQSLSMWMHDLHGQFFVFGPGRQAVGWIGVALLVSCLSGIWLWWPRREVLAMAFRWGRTTDTLSNLHQLVGFWIALPLAVLSLSGALISFPAFTRGLVGAFALVAPPAGAQRGGPEGPASRTMLSADQAASRALDGQPGAHLLTLNLPTRAADTPRWRAQVRTAKGATLTLAIDDAQAGDVRVVPDRPRPEGDQLIRFNRQLHGGGDGMPLAWKLVITVAGLAPAILAVTGVLVWARRQWRKAARRRPQARPLGRPAAAE